MAKSGTVKGLQAKDPLEDSIIDDEFIFPLEQQTAPREIKRSKAQGRESSKPVVSGSPTTSAPIPIPNAYLPSFEEKSPAREEKSPARSVPILGPADIGTIEDTELILGTSPYDPRKKKGSKW